jgi:two-component system, OmpR family, KDP operon response regulator KdpE
VPARQDLQMPPGVVSIEPQVVSGTAGPRILVIDEDPGIRRLLRRELKGAGYCVQDAQPGSDVASRIGGRVFDLLVLCIDSPDCGGPAAIRVVRDGSSVPIVALSVRGDEETAVQALHLGADDYVQKPFRVNELLARVTNALRRRAQELGRQTLVVSDGLEIDLLRRRVWLRGQTVHLPLKSFEVLRVLAESAGKVLTHKQLLCAVWGPRRVDQVAYLRIAIRNLRNKLEDDPAHPAHILTETGVGYRLDVRNRTNGRTLA